MSRGRSPLCFSFVRASAERFTSLIPSCLCRLGSLASEGSLDVAQAVALPEVLDGRGDELAPTRQGIVAPSAIMGPSQFLEFKSRN